MREHRHLSGQRQILSGHEHLGHGEAHATAAHALEHRCDVKRRLGTAGGPALPAPEVGDHRRAGRAHAISEQRDEKHGGGAHQQHEAPHEDVALPRGRDGEAEA